MKHFEEESPTNYVVIIGVLIVALLGYLVWAFLVNSNNYNDETDNG